jgi:pheromone shutdown protein TraB
MLKLAVGGFYQLLKLIGLEPGGEFKVAMEEARAVGARIVYGDQDVELTVKRLSQSMSMQVRQPAPALAW